MARPLKFLPDGSPDPLWKPRQSGKSPLKFLPDGSANPLWKPRPSGKRQAPREGQKQYHRGTSHSKSSWERAQFIAWDGEGHDLPPHNEHGDRRHLYTYCANSEGDELHDERGLSSSDLFELLLESAEKNKYAINVVFGGGYDINMILADIPRESLEIIAADDGKNFIHVHLGRQHYAVRFVQRKYLSIARYRDYSAMYKQGKNGKYTHDFSARIVLWDVIGFFQSAFVPAVESWLGKDLPDLKLIREGKALRKDFQNTSIEYIRRYNAAELRTLVMLMERVHESLDNMGLKLSRWDGAGAVAAAINKKHAVKEWLGGELPEEVQTAAQHAYFGGRIEMGRFGRHDGIIYHYDINSAYPAAMCKLPQLALGRWIKMSPDKIKDAPVISCCLVKWNLSAQHLRFNPFPYRSDAQQKVLFPSEGVNWIWKPEVEAALELCPDGIEILDCWAWIPAGDFCPYEWISEYYARRQELVAQTKRDGILRGEEKIIKLGLNSLYGKTAQRAGYDISTGRVPPYHNLAYAGMITAATRAALWKAAMQRPDNIVCLATDGIFSTAPLELDYSPEKKLGAWDYGTHDGMILVQSGFYWIKDGGEWEGWSRGFDKTPKGPDYQKNMLQQINLILKAWKNKHCEDIFFPCTRFITLKTALCGGDWFDKWRSWYAMRQPDGTLGRRLKLRPTGTKRLAHKGKPAREMVLTSPELNYTPDILSEIYTIPWLDESGDGDIISDNENEIFNED